MEINNLIITINEMQEFLKYDVNTKLPAKDIQEDIEKIIQDLNKLKIRLSKSKNFRGGYLD